MRKKFLAVTMALCLSCVPFGAYAEETETETSAADSAGGSEEVTAESLLAGTGTETPDSMSGDMKLNLDAGLEVTMDGVATSIDLVMTGDFAMQVLENPVQMALDGTYEMTLFGETQEIGMEMYLVMADDYSTADIYVKVDEGSDTAQWQHTQATDEELKKSLGLDESADLASFFTDDSALFEELGIDWTLEETDSAYQLSTSASLKDLLSGLDETIEEALSASGLSEDDQETVMECLNGIVLNMSYTYDKEELLPSAFHMDLNDSDLSALNEYLANLVGGTSDSEDETETESEIAYTVKLNDVSIDGTYTYNDVTEIQVPADALTTPVESASDASVEVYLDFSGADESETETEAAS